MKQNIIFHFLFLLMTTNTFAGNGTKPLRVAEVRHDDSVARQRAAEYSGNH